MTEKQNKRIPVNVPAKIYVSLQEYSEETGIPITAVVTEALDEWLQVSGATRLEFLRKRRGEERKVLTFPAIRLPISDQEN